MIKRRRVARAFKSIAIFYFILSTTSCQEAEEDVRPLEQAELEATVRRLASKQLEEPLLSAGARQQPVQQAANGASHATRLAAGAVANISQVLLDRFHYLFDQLANDSAQAFQEQQAGQQQQQQQHNQQQHQHQLDKLTELFVIKSGGEAAEGSRPSGNGGEPSQLQSSLETRATFGGHYGAPQAYDQLQESNKRNFVRILNRVFSRIELPDSFRRSAGSTSSANLPSGPPSVSSSTGVQVGSPVIGTGSQGHCGSHIGCIAELPNFPMILKLKPNVSASFTIYTRERGYKSGQRILFEPLMHYQLQDGDKLSDLELQREVVNITRQLKIEKLLPQIMPHYKAHMGAKRHYSYANHHLGRQDSLRKRLQTTAASWISSGNRIVTSKEFPFDLSALEQSGFNASLTTRIIIGGYFAKEDEEWIDEIIRQWLLLEPSNVIKVSWQDSNRGLYHSAAYNSRIVGRQLSLFLHYLNELFHIDLNRFHLVGHSLGAHIAGFVGADNEGQIARITGLDPAGPIFVDLHQIHRLDSSDAKFVDVVHTNGGTITKGALGLSTPSGHVDYYCNGGSLQPGCFFSSVTMSIMDPVERIACNHRRSYRYFTEIIKLAVRHQRPAGADEQLGDLSYRSAGSAEFELASGIEAGAPHSPLTSEVDESKFPQAFLFEAKQEDLVKLVQPDVKLIRHGHQERAGEWQLAPTRKLIEFHSLNPDFPRDKHGLYYFRTRTEAPFFGSKQYALRFGVEQPVKRKMTLSIKINTTLVAELELDELDESRSLVFVLQNSNLIDHSNLFSGRSSRAPDLWLMWRQRSFNLLLAHQSNELHLNSIELELLDGNEPADSSLQPPQPSSGETSPNNQTASTGADSDQGRSMRQRQQPAVPSSSSIVIRYEPNVVNNKNNENFLSRIQHNGAGGGPANGFIVTRNQWHKFDGRPVAVP